MPLYRRLPKRGFKNPFRVVYNALNIEQLNVFDAGTTVTPELLASKGLVHDSKRPTKLLARGKLEKSLVIQVQKVSEAARIAVEKAGGRVEGI
jgi:large subunit ribosomal protein L15